MEDKRKRGLGRGLSALLGNTPLAAPAVAAAAEPSAIIDLKGTVQVPVAHMQSGRYQPRMEFDQEALEDLADSIRAKGIIQPILVRPLPEDTSRYEIIAGERRWRAAQMARLHEVPVLVRDFNDQEAAEVALIENLQRRDLSPLEEAEGYRRLIDDFSRTQEDLAQALGKSRSHVANMIRLLALPEPVKVYMRDGRLSAGHARALLNAEDPIVLAQQVVSKGLNVRQTEKLATDKGGVKARKPRPTQEKDADTLALERDLARVLGLKVEVEFRGRGGQVVIHYDTLDQLDDILYRLNNPSDRHRGESVSEDDNASYEMDDFAADNTAFASSFGRSAAPAPQAPMPQGYGVMAGGAAASQGFVSHTAPVPNADLVASLDQLAPESVEEANELVASFDEGEEARLSVEALLALEQANAASEVQPEDLTAETADDAEELIASFDEIEASEVDLDDSADAWADELMAETTAEAEALVAGVGDDDGHDDGDLSIEDVLSAETDTTPQAEEQAEAVEVDLDDSADAWADELMAETTAEAEALVAGVGEDDGHDDGDLSIEDVLSADSDEDTEAAEAEAEAVEPAADDGQQGLVDEAEADADAEAVLNALRAAVDDDELDDGDLSIEDVLSAEPDTTPQAEEQAEGVEIDLDDSADVWADELMAETTAEAEALVAGVGEDDGHDDGDLSIEDVLSAEPDTTPQAEEQAEGVEIDLDDSADVWADELMAETTAEAEALVAGVGEDDGHDDGDLSIEDVLSADSDEDTEAAEVEAETVDQAADSGQQGLVDEAEAEAVLNALRAAVDGDDPLAALARLGAFAPEDDQDEEIDPDAVFQASADAWADSLKGTSVGDALNSDSELQALLSQIKEQDT